MVNGVAEVGYKVRATEYMSPDGTMRAWWTTCDQQGWPLVAVARRVPHQSLVWTVQTVRPGWDVFGDPGRSARYFGQYRNLVRARMDVLGGNGHIYRGHSSVTEVRDMSRSNILALARG